jgi:hypothetical protein
MARWPRLGSGRGLPTTGIGFFFGVDILGALPYMIISLNGLNNSAWAANALNWRSHGQCALFFMFWLSLARLINQNIASMAFHGLNVMGLSERHRITTCQTTIGSH